MMDKLQDLIGVLLILGFLLLLKRILDSFFQRQPPGYQRLAIRWVASAKKPETRARRLDQLIVESRSGRRLGEASASNKK